MAKYRVVGPFKVGGVNPGGVVDLGDGVNVPALIEAGHVKPLTEKPNRGAE